MWHRFWPNQYSIKASIILLQLVLMLGILTVPSFSYAENKSAPLNYPGIIDTFEQLVNLDRDKFRRKSDSIAINPKVFSDLNGLKDIKIDPDFLMSLFLHSESKYLSLMSYHPCHFYSLLETGLLKSAGGKSNNIIIEFVNDKNQRETALVPTADFLAKIYQDKCTDHREMRNSFSLRNIGKTLDNETYPVPTNYSQCQEIHSRFLNNPKTPYYCHMTSLIGNSSNIQLKMSALPPSDIRQRQQLSQELATISEFKTKIKDKHFYYLQGLCQNIGSTAKFCQQYFNQSFWPKVLSKERPLEIVQEYCKALYPKKTNLNELDYKTCINALDTTPDSCFYSTPNYNALTPKPSCPDTSLALNQSRMFVKYKDCPGKTDNQGIVNFTRLILHHRKTPIALNENHCSTNSAEIFASENLSFDNTEAWNVGYCYDDKINAVEVCLPTILGKHPTSELAEDKVIARILQKLKGLGAKETCEFASENEFNLNLLKYKLGCFLVYDPNNCSTMSCPKKIFYNGLETNLLRYKANIRYDYFPNSIAKEKYSLFSILESAQKMPQKKVMNLTSVKFFLEQNPDYIIHGVGCAEDLLPTFFKKNTFNQCTPMPFIIDGIVEKENRSALVTRTAIDDLHAPRMIDWNYIFSAVKNFQQNQLLNYWPLYVTN